MRRACLIPLAFAVALPAAGCSGSAGSRDSSALTLYTCATESVEQAVIQGFEKAHPGASVHVFRAPTGQLNSRVAADVRSGGIRADVIWACDPLSMHGYDKQGLLAAWQPADAAEIPQRDRTPHFTGVDMLYMALVVHSGHRAPASWAELAAPGRHERIALPDPTFAASALGLLGYFAATPGYGMEYYRRLKAAGAVQVNSPTDALTGVEQGSYTVGVTLAESAYADRKKGSPIRVVWPRPGAVAIYAPIGITTKSDRSPLAAQFASFVASRSGQRIMARQGTYVTLPGLRGPPIPAGAPIVAPDWPSLFGRYQSLLAQYKAIFG